MSRTASPDSFPLSGAALDFMRPSNLQAQTPPEWRGLARDSVRLLISDDAGHHHAHFFDLAEHLSPGDLLVVNESATLPASLPARGRLGGFKLNLSTRYDDRLWLTEPRWSAQQPGPMPWREGEHFQVGGVHARFVAPFANSNRLWFVAFADHVQHLMARHGQPIQYGYLGSANPPLPMFQTIFGHVPGSAEMPSAARPFSQRVLVALERRGIAIARIVLHTGVSSLEVEHASDPAALTYPEPFSVPPETATAVNRTRKWGGRVIAVGTTVVRALESAVRDGVMHPTSGFTRLFIEPRRGIRVVDSLITGFHDPRTTHLAMLFALAGEDRVRTAYAEAIQHGYLWHEFGDSHLLHSARVLTESQNLSQSHRVPQRTQESLGMNQPSTQGRHLVL